MTCPEPQDLDIEGEEPSPSEPVPESPVDGAPQRLRRQAGYVPAVLVGSIVATVVVLVLWHWPVDTVCYQEAVEIEIDGTSTLSASCNTPTFEAVADSIEADRTALALDADHEVDQPNATAARSAQVVWIVLIGVTAGLAWATAIMVVRTVQTVVPINDDGWRWGALAAILVVAVALGLLWFLAADFRFGEYDDIYPNYTQGLVLLVLAPGSALVTGLVVLCEYLGSGKPTQLSDLVSVEMVLNRLTGLLGAALSLAVVTTGARWQMIGHLPGGESVSSSVVLLYGGLFTALAAAAYVPTQRRLAERREILINACVERQVGDYSTSVLAHRKAIRADIQSGRGALANLQGSLSILAPAIAAAVSTLIG